jgi:hypothetical protein
MKADLGDGNGKVDQIMELREDFGASFLGIGTCLESLVGGNHFRRVPEFLYAWRPYL